MVVNNEIFLGSGASLTGISAGITMADQYRLTSSVTGNGILTSNLERPDSSGFAKIGTGMTESSGVFSFPSDRPFFP